MSRLMKLLRAVVTTLLLCTALSVACSGQTPSPQAVAQEQPPAQPQQQEEFIPIDQLPPQDQLPAAPLLVGAYVFVIVALFAYVFSVSRRLNTVQREVERLEGDIKRSARG
jgi:CcmD family protein